MKANQLLQKLGHKLLGKQVNMPAMGECPGGVATVIRLAPDTAAPWIVFQVNLSQWEKTVVFGYEDVSLLTDQLGVIQLHENWRN